MEIKLGDLMIVKSDNWPKIAAKVTEIIIKEDCREIVARCNNGRIPFSIVVIREGR